MQWMNYHPGFSTSDEEHSIVSAVVDIGCRDLYNTTIVYLRDRIMRQSLFTFCVVALLFAVSPAEAQLRTDGLMTGSSVRVYDHGQSGFSLNKFFGPAHFRMSHSFELSSGSFGGRGSSLGMYTNSMMWQFSSKLAARADIAFAYSPDGNNNLNNVVGGGNSGQVFIRNAEVAYRPAKNMQIHLSYRNSPYGGYYGATGYGGYGRGYGYGSGYGYQSGGLFQATYGRDSRDMFWNNNLN